MITQAEWSSITIFKILSEFVVYNGAVGPAEFIVGCLFFVAGVHFVGLEIFHAVECGDKYSIEGGSFAVFVDAHFQAPDLGDHTDKILQALLDYCHVLGLALSFSFILELPHHNMFYHTNLPEVLSSPAQPVRRQGILSISPEGGGGKVICVPGKNHG